MSVAACPGCVALDAASVAPVRTDASEAATEAVELYLPGIHCGACIATVERTLRAAPGVREARVNLTRRRVLVTPAPGGDPADWIDRLSRAGIEAHETTAVQGETRAGDDLLVPLGVAGFAMMNVMLLSVAVWAGAEAATRDMMHWISALIALPATAYAAQPFFRAALAAARRGRLVMDTPISLAILLATGLSLHETARGGTEAYFDAALSLTFFLLAGRLLDQRMRRKVRSAAADLAALEPARAVRVTGGIHASVPLSEIAVGDALRLAAGARVPVDGRIDAPAQVDRSALTGEAQPLALAAGAAVVAGDVLLTGPVTLIAEAVGEDTTLRRMARLVSVAEGARGRYSGLAERAAGVYTPLVHVIAAATLAGWLWATGDLRQSLGVAIATLIITCPCALGLAIPAVSAAATGRLFRMGALVKSDTGLERLAEVDTVIFDKTGTLTRATLDLPDGMPQSAREVLAGLARASDHPLSRALRDGLSQVTPAPLADIVEHPGRGLEARTMTGERVALLAAADGSGTVFTLGPATWPILRREAPVPGAGALVATLSARGYDTGLLTGDADHRAQRMAQALGLPRHWANVTPEGKTAVLADLAARGRRVLMVGDGLNDAAALAAAHASIAPGSALDISRNAADVVLTAPIAGVAEVLAVARAARRRMVENLVLAAAYNAVAVPLAVGGGVTPLMAAVAMSSSSILVTLNALRVAR